MPIEKDTKNWTWVIDKPCPDCGFDATNYPNSAISGAIRDNASAWAPVLQRPDVRVRPNDSTWSALEYAAHVRDVLAVYTTRLQLMLDEDDPQFPNWDQDETAIAERYNEQDPETVGSQLTSNAAGLADSFDALTQAQSSRPGRRSDGAGFTVSSLAKYMTHDLVHHRWDVGAH
ncbi:MAG TPA: DinB family protein [Galbitalea sp.]|jgi:hypothetical protein|nr:DinB family protein [Galbitalea sp.]